MCVEVLVTGTFNVLHAGHVQLLEYASTFGKVTVGINADSYLHGKYGSDKTVPMLNRAYLLRSIKFVDEVVVFTADDPSELIRQLKPQFFVRGPDYGGVELVEQVALDEVGAQLIIHCGDKIHNASSLVEHLPQQGFQPMASGAVLPWLSQY